MEKEYLYRYIPFSSFVSLILSKTLFMSNPLKDWEDTYEGLIYQALKTDEGKKRINQCLNKYTNDTEEVKNNLEIYVPNSRALCWSKNNNSIAMWSIYSYNNEAVRIKVERDWFEKYDVIVKDIYYAPNNSSIEDEVKRVFNDDGYRISDIFGIKRKDFEYEEEVRIFRHFNPRVKVGEQDPNIHIDNISNFIQGVMVHPKAKSSYVNTVKLLCDSNGITFEGKSKLYDFEI